MKLFDRGKAGQPGRITLPVVCAGMFFIFFLVGVFSANLCLSDEALWVGFLNENQLLQFSGKNGSVMDFLKFAFRNRMIPWIFIVVTGIFGWGQFFFAGWFGWLGISGGFLITALIQRHGLQGILLMGGLGTPHIPIYAAAYILLLKLIWIYRREQRRRNRESFVRENQKKYTGTYLLFALLLTGCFVLGILAEYYVNPFVLERLR